MIKIDKNIPMPESKVSNTRFPFDTLEIGDSFLYSTQTEPTYRTRCNSLVYSNGIRLKKQFKHLPTSEGMRIWRIK